METKKAMDFKRPGNLNLNAPLLSTKRPILANYTLDEYKETCSRIPFSWEQVPGTPKTHSRNDKMVDSTTTPRCPKLPPSRWRQEVVLISNHDDHVHDHDDGFDADVDENDDGKEEEKDDTFTDAADVLSLTEAIDIVEKQAEKFSNGFMLGSRNKKISYDYDCDYDYDGLDGLTNVECVDFLNGETCSPSYIIERFLPDATALAVASTGLLSSVSNGKKLGNYFCGSGKQSCSSSSSSVKGCGGMQVLLPWRLKHKICGVKGSVREHSSVVVHPRCTLKQKKI